ncbi:MAG: DUF6884 domain-containing protein [Dehalococcoidia bacterium]
MTDISQVMDEIDVEPFQPAGGNVLVGLALPGLPFRGPEPSLLRIDRTHDQPLAITHNHQRDGAILVEARHGIIRQIVHKAMQLSLRHRECIPEPADMVNLQRNRLLDYPLVRRRLSPYTLLLLDSMHSPLRSSSVHHQASRAMCRMPIPRSHRSGIGPNHEVHGVNSLRSAMPLPPQRLLLMACSQRKRPDSNLLPAIERYDGPAFRVLRRYLRSVPVQSPEVYILSAEFGLIPASQPIPYYDRRMTAERAREVRDSVRDRLRGILAEGCYEALYINAGKEYQQALGDIAAPAGTETRIIAAEGSQGKRLSALHNWLYGESGGSLYPSVVGGRRQARIRGVVVVSTKEQVLKVARLELMRQSSDPYRFQSWYVLIDNEKVGPKWLVTQLTGLAPASFGTSEACRLLQLLGIEVRRI